MRKLELIVGNYNVIAMIEETDGRGYVAVKPLCDALGISFQKQHEKIVNNSSFNYHLMVTVAEDGKQREMLCIPVKKVGGWLFSINAKRVKPEIRERLLMFQEDLHTLIYNAISGKVTPEMFFRMQKGFEDFKIEMREVIAMKNETIARLEHELVVEKEISKRVSAVNSSCAGKQLQLRKQVKQLLQ